MDAPLNNTDAAAVRRGKIRRQRVIAAIIGGVVVLAVVLIIASIVRARRNNTNSGVVTAQVGRATIIQRISATGTVDAQTGAEVNIGSQITGRIKDLYVDIGTKVKAGQVIAVLDLPDVVAQYNQAEAALHSAQLAYDQQVSGVGLQRTTVTTDINKAQAGLASAEATYNQDARTAGAQVRAAQATVNQAQATYKNAEIFLGREEQLLAKGYVARQDVDNARAQANVAAAQLDTAQQNLALARTRTATALQTDQAAIQNARAILASARSETAQNTIKAQQVAAARAGVAQAQANVAYWQAQYNKTIIRTPISGTITTLSTQQGETVAAGLSAPTLVTVVNLDRLQVNAFVDETDIGGVRIGQPATVTVDAYPNKEFPGHVVKIAAGGTIQQNVVTYDTTVALANPQGLLKPSMSATTNIVVSEHRDVVAVPIEAIKYVGTTPVVYVAQGKQFVARQVVIGISDDTNTEILKGVQPGETIVLAGYPPSGGGPRIGVFGPGGGGRGGGGGQGR
ncbi:MAG TPA: efflux RND transporter periplasmic adaptor subunit [Armatimonadota bacterium]|jgi:RND family efflux transporter MFP subunit